MKRIISCVALFLCAVAAFIFSSRQFSSSPSKGKIAFISTRDNKLAIYTMKPDGSGTRLLMTKPKDAYFDMTFSANQRKLAFTIPESRKMEWLPNLNIHVFDLQSGAKTRATNFHGNNAIRAVTPCFHPNGKQIPFTGLTKTSADKDSSVSVYLTNLNTNGTKFVTQTVDGGNPQYDRKGQWLCYTSGKNNQSEIYILKADGTQKKRLTHNSFLDMSPSFHPNNKSIVFSSVRNGNYQIFTIDLKSRKEYQLTDTGQNRSPSYSPDGKHIVFISVRDGNEEIYLMNADGTNEKRVTNNPARDLNPIWLN